MICPYSEKRIDCLKFGPYMVPPGPCCKCTVPNPIKAAYFCMPELDDGERHRRDEDTCSMCNTPVPRGTPLCEDCYQWLREGPR